MRVSPTNGTTGAYDVLALDIGGSHASAALVSWRGGDCAVGDVVDVAVDSGGDAESVLSAWASAAQRACGESAKPIGVGVAMPGPFDYANGICTMRGVGKYEKLYGTNVRAELTRRLGLSGSQPVLFENDAACFLLGEFWAGVARESRRAIGVTLGTGFGSAFCTREGLVAAGASVPPGGWLYGQPWRDTTADERFSTRGLLRDWKAEFGADVANVRELAGVAREDARARAVFARFGSDLAEFLAPHAMRFEADMIVAGGNISRAWPLFGEVFAAEMAVARPGCLVLQSVSMERAALAGAARLPLPVSAP